MSNESGIPVVATLVCDDELFDFDNYIGFYGIDGDNNANKAIKECDLLICFGARMNIKQVGKNRKDFAKQAKIIRFDIDQNELDYRVNNEEIVCEDLKVLIPQLEKNSKKIIFRNPWIQKDISRSFNINNINDYAFDVMGLVCDKIPENVSISLGIGSHRRWFVSNRIIKNGWRIYQTAGLASMGYSLPASIGLYYATKKPVVSIDGDGGLLMNVQELQLISREQLPINVIVFNNQCLGEIMEFQKTIFNKNYMGTTPETGYQSGNYLKIADAFGLDYKRISSLDEAKTLKLDIYKPTIIEVVVPTNIEE